MKKGFTLIELMITISLLFLVLSVLFGIESSLKKSSKTIDNFSENSYKISKILRLLNNARIQRNDDRIIFIYNGKKYLYQNGKIISSGKTLFMGVNLHLKIIDKNLYKIILEIKKIKFKINIIKKGEIYDEKKL